MRVPNPRKFIEIVLCFIVTAVVLASPALVVAVMAIFAAIEALVDKLREPRSRS